MTNEELRDEIKLILEPVKVDINYIKEFQAKQNGRLFTLDSDYYDFKEKMNHIVDVRASLGPDGCPALPTFNTAIIDMKKEIASVKEGIEVLSFFSKYPKLSTFMVVGFFVITIGVGITWSAKVKTDFSSLNKNQIELLQNQKDIIEIQRQVKIDLSTVEKKLNPPK